MPCAKLCKDFDDCEIPALMNTPPPPSDELQALRQQLAQRLNLLRPDMLDDWTEAQLRSFAAELDEDDALASLTALTDEELEAQALASSDTQAPGNRPE